MTWAAGEVIVLREVLGGRIRSARPLRVVDDRPDALAAYLPPRSEVAWPRLIGEAQSQTPDQGWRLALEEWRGPGCLFVLPAGEAFAAVAFLDRDDGSPLGWKVDFLAPPQRWPGGLDTLDWALDLLVSADLTTVRVKDEDDLAQLELAGLLGEGGGEQVRDARRRAEARLAARATPFSGRWAAWRPPEDAGAALELPPGWDRLPALNVDADAGADPERPPSPRADPERQPWLGADPERLPSLRADPERKPSLRADPERQPWLRADPEHRPVVGAGRAGRPGRSGSGTRLLDETGRSLLDLDLAGGTLLHGHAHPRIVEAVTRQAPLGLGASAIGLAAVLADRLVDRFEPVEAVAWTGSGEEAWWRAVRSARRTTGRRRVACWTPAAPLGGSDEDADLVFLPDDDLGEAVRQLVNGGDRWAALIVDPLAVVASADWPPADLPAWTSLAPGALLVADERPTLGAGRSGGHPVVGLRPDLVVLGASLFGGMGAGALGGRRDLLAGSVGGATAAGVTDTGATATGAAAATGGVHPMLAAAGLATLALLTPDTMAELAELARSLRTRVGDGSRGGVGGAVRLPLEADVGRLAQRGVRVDGSGWGWLATVSSDADVDEAAAALEELR